MNLNGLALFAAIVISGTVEAHGSGGSEIPEWSSTEQLEQICGTFGSSYVDATHWTLFRKRSGSATQPVFLCLDNDCGPATLQDGYFQREVAGELNSAHGLTAKTSSPRDPRVLQSARVDLSTKTCPMGNPAFAPDSTVGLDVVLTIEKTTSSLPGGFPTMGAVGQSYGADGTYVYQGAGGPNQLKGTGTYTYAKSSHSTAVEDAMQSSDFFTLPYRMEYTFQRPDSGRWIQNFAGGLIVFEGSFTISRTNSQQQWAPDSFTGARITLLSSATDEHTCFELVRSRYDTTTYSARTLGVRAHRQGSYVIHKLSARSVVEEDSDTSGLRYVRVYTFTDPRGGRWQETDATTDERTEGVFRYNDR
jgi:hypothetical protein